jgi:prepilin-type N-terminal cleavage/methylation domain-containing protein
MLRRAAMRKFKLRDEGGFTLPELSVAVIVMLIVGAAVMTFIVVAARQYSGQEDRVTHTDEARNALQRITGELRDAGAVSYIDARTVQAEVRQADGTYHQVTFACEGAAPTGTCSRSDAVTGGEELLVEGVVNSNNFAHVTGSTLAGTGSDGGAIAVVLELDLEDAENPVTLSSAVRPRNCSNTAGVINPC